MPQPKGYGSRMGGFEEPFAARGHIRNGSGEGLLPGRGGISID